MAKIAYILLCHKDPDAVIRQAERLTAAGDFMAIHFDANASTEDYAKITKTLADNPGVSFTKRRVKCGWGEWSLVKATLHAVQAALASFPRATHFYMLSGDCMAIKPAAHTHRFLDENDADFIETFDFFNSDWIKTGMKEERLTYRHFFNERSQKRFFYGSLILQKTLRLSRRLPADLEMRIGSQWWCLRRQTIEKVVEFASSRRDVMRFFATTWIPDETFFQTIVPHLVPSQEIRSRTLTLLMFSDYGMPVTFYNDHYDMLISQDFLFARKISPEAADLKNRLGDLYAATDAKIRISAEAPGLFSFLTGRGRIGKRFGTRFWEAQATLGRERELLIVICKKWHVAKRLLERVRQVTNVPVAEYIFNEQIADLPDLGGLQTSLEKRSRHRRALMRVLFDYQETDRMIVCIDPANIELLDNFAADRSMTRMLEIECTYSDDFLVGHARRVGLAGEHTPAETLDRLLPTIRNDILFEIERIHDAGFANYTRMRQKAEVDENAAALARFLSISTAAARGIVDHDSLFAD